jgi:putative aldouronate transport system substrate-binding protein
MRKALCVFLSVVTFSIPLFAKGGNQSSGAAGGDAPVSVSIGAWWGGARFGDDAWGQFVKQKFNVDITFVTEEWSDYFDILRLWAAADQLPDAFSGYPPTEAWFGDFVDQGIIRDIPDAVINKYPNIKKVQDKTTLVQSLRNFYGKHYYIARPESVNGYKIANNQSIIYRKDWAAKLGITETPRDMETLYKMLYGFVYNDPDGNGKRDTYGITGSALAGYGGVNELYTPFGAFPNRWVNGSDGKAIPGYADEGAMVSALTWLRRAYSEGLIDPEFPSDYNVVNGKLAQGIFGANVRTDSFIRDLAEQIVGGGHSQLKEPTAILALIGSLSATPGGRIYHEVEPDSSGYVFKEGLSDIKLEKILEITNWILSEEGITMQRFGLKDIDFRVDAAGNITRINQTISYPSNLGHFALWDFDFSLDLPEALSNYPKAWRDITWEYYMDPKWGANVGAENAKNDKVNLLATVIVTPERSRFAYTDKAALDAKLLEIISGTGDVRTMYREFIAECNSRGMQAMIDSVNRAMTK